MKRVTILMLSLLLTATAAFSQRTGPGSEAELAAITERGRQLAAYDVAAWYGSDAVMAAKPDNANVERYIAQRSAKGWVVAFGRLNESRDKFLIAYEAIQGASPKEFTVKKYETPKADSGFLLVAAKAVDSALADFAGEQRPYNAAVLPAAAGQLYVYIIPAQTKAGIYPHGGDVRYLISADGSKIVQKRQLHKSILEIPPAADPATAVAGFHIAVMDDLPEDTDVFYVLTRKPSTPELIGTKHYLYQVDTDGTVRYLMTVEAFMKLNQK